MASWPGTGNSIIFFTVHLFCASVLRWLTLLHQALIKLHTINGAGGLTGTKSVLTCVKKDGSAPPFLKELGVDFHANLPPPPHRRER